MASIPRFAAAAAGAAAAAAAAATELSSSSSSARRRVTARNQHVPSRREGGASAPSTAAASASAAAASCVNHSDVSVARSPVSWTEVLGSVRVGRVAFADAAAVEAVGDDAASFSPLEDGDKPELIKRADEQAEQKGQLRRPAQFADQFGEVSNLTAVHSFEGFRLDMSKAVTPTFFTAHNIFFGSPQFPNGHYQGALTVVGEHDTMVRASMDAECNVSVDFHAPLGLPGLTGKASLQQGKNEVLQGTAIYSGETCAGQVSFGTAPTEVSYNQAITPNLSMGGQGQFSAAQQAVGLLYGFKYDTPSWAVLGRLIGGGANVVTAQYVRRVVPGRVTLGAEYQAQLGSASQMSIGAEFVLKQSKMSASVDSNGKVDSALEVRFGTFPTLPVTFTISSSLEHAENKAAFGLALTCGQ